MTKANYVQPTGKSAIAPTSIGVYRGSYFPTDILNHFVGIDKLLDDLNTISENASKNSKFPPYNIKKDGDNRYIIEMAVAGFDKRDIEIIVNQNKISIEGKKVDDTIENSYLHKGIANRNFKTEFSMGETLEVRGAMLENGMLYINFENIIPESKKMKKIEIF